jgi:transcriptional regulator with XRE-family HTH domain
VAQVTSSEVRPPVGVLLRGWRDRRSISQLDLAIQAGVSARHVSFVETGRSRPSRELLLRLAEELNVPLRERNPILLAAGYAPAYPARRLEDDEMAPVRAALEKILAGYQPYPAAVVDRGWNLVAANPSIQVLIAAADPALLEPPVNVLRLSLHPSGLAGSIRNLAQWRGHILGRLAREAAVTGDRELTALHQELLGYPGGEEPTGADQLAVPLRIGVGTRELALISTVTTFGTAVDVTLAELSIEAFLPADAATASALADLRPPA